MPRHMGTCGSSSMARSLLELVQLVSVAVHTVPCSLLFPSPRVKKAASLKGQAMMPCLDSVTLSQVHSSMEHCPPARIRADSGNCSSKIRSCTSMQTMSTIDASEWARNDKSSLGEEP